MVFCLNPAKAFRFLAIRLLQTSPDLSGSHPTDYPHQSSVPGTFLSVWLPVQGDHARLVRTRPVQLSPRDQRNLTIRNSGGGSRGSGDPGGPSELAGEASELAKIGAGHGWKFGGASGFFWGIGGLLDDVWGFRGRVVTSPPLQCRDPSRRGEQDGDQRAAWETKLKRGRRFVRVLLNQLKALDVPQNFPNFVMSSPSVPVVSPTALDECQGPESVVRGGGGGFSGGSETDQVLSRVAKGKGGILGGDSGEALSLPALGGPPESSLFSPAPGVPSERSLSPPTPIPSIMEVFLRKQVEALTTSLAVREGELQRATEDCDVARIEKEAMEQERNTSVCVVMERVLEVQGLREHLTQMEGQPAGEAEGWGQVLEGDVLWAELEAARRREDWLANEAALGCAGILRWVREHRVLLDSASVAFASIQDGLMQGSAVQPPELQQGMARLERLLVGHRQHNAVAPGSWWEVAADAGEALPGLAEVLVVVRAQMEVDLGVGLPGGPGRE
ncbi:hypothetical protein E4T56_gene12905 [Termitomyces sp. T112]|nr:hypothetical protein E4T56_gene12905 [Termitomyces sp. T112]